MPQVSKPVIISVTVELYVHNLVNAERRTHGLNELYMDPALSEIARAHSMDMAQRGFFAHETPEGLDATQRARRKGYVIQRQVGNTTYTGVAENIARIGLFRSAEERTHFIKYSDGRQVVTGRSMVYSWHTPTELAAQTVTGWMNSPGHRRNIMTPYYEREGIGVAFTADYVFVTQNLF